MRFTNFLTFLLFFTFHTSGISQWEIYAEHDEYLYALLEVPANEIVVIGSKAKYWSLDGEAPEERFVEGQYGFLYSSKVIDNRIGYLGGGCYFTVQDFCDPHTLYKTLDGGANWNRIASPITFASFGNIVAMDALSEHELLLLHEYGGLLKLNTLKNEVDSLSLGLNEEANYFLSFEKYDHEHWLISYFYYQLDGSYLKHFATQNAGKDWIELFPGSQHTDHLTQVKYIDRNTWMASSNNGKIYSISDQQRTELFNPGEASLDRVTDLFVYSGKSIYCSTYNSETEVGAIYRTRDVGKNWELEIEKDSMHFRSIFFNSPGHGFAIGNQSTIWERKPTLNSNTPIQELIIQPNPAKEWICIPEIEEYKSIRVDIYDSAGRLLSVEEVKEGRLNILPLGLGMYIVRFFDHDKMFLGQGKFIKA